LFYIVFNILVYLALEWLSSTSKDTMIPHKKKRIVTTVKKEESSEKAQVYMTFKNLCYYVDGMFQYFIFISKPDLKTPHV
jgi:hypothetical protein